MRRPPLFRLIALVTALLGGLSAPAQALAHGRAHEHLAHEHLAHEHEGIPAGAEDGLPFVASHADGDHAAGGSAELEAWSLEPARSDDHAHGHPALDAIAGIRDLRRLAVAYAVPDVVPPGFTVRVKPREILAPARTDHLLLARPDPERGPPPSLRAPPTR